MKITRSREIIVADKFSLLKNKKKKEEKELADTQILAKQNSFQILFNFCNFNYF